MTGELPETPWETLHQLVATAEFEQADRYLQTLPPGETARVLSRLDEQEQTELLRNLQPADAAALLESLPDVQAIELIEHLDPASAAAIVHELESDDQADLVGELSANEAAAILAELDPDEASEIRALADYDADVAGGLMVTELLAFPQHWTVAQVIDDMRAKADLYREYEIQYAYVVTGSGQLSGVLSLRDLLLARHRQPIAELMIRDPLTVRDEAPLEELREFFDQHRFLGVPVVDDRDRLQGVVRRASVDEAFQRQTARDYRRSQGIVQEEIRSMPVWTRSRRRLAWLSVNILLNVMAASVIAWYQETLQQVIALAVFLPIISDMSGCSGNQAVAVSMRELALGLVKPGELLRVWGKEAAVGLINGCALGALIALVAWLWKGNPFLGLVVGSALCANTILAVSIGGLLPLWMRLLRLDPALASGPILTTITDMCGFFLVLSLAALLLHQLV
ncbi:MAG: magnesium transporter [Planctomycetes bacterium]|nr:magnesium transporter [Planctomycetota bacterium]